jgi:hypothetical protein
MRPAEDIKKLIEKMNDTTSANMDRRVLSDALQALADSKETQSADTGPNRWRIIMKSRITKLAAAAVIIFAVTAPIIFFNKTVPIAYGGIEQTVEAYRHMRSIHLHHESPPAAEPQDMWIEFDENGKPVRLRLEEGLGDTFRIVTWVDGVIKFYRPAEKEFVVIDQPGAGREIEHKIELVNPRLAVQAIYDEHLEGKLDIEIEQNATEDGLVRVIATDSTPLDELPKQAFRVRYVLLVDPSTKLATQREEYFLREGKYVLESRFIYDGYNEPIDEQMFVFEVPEAVQVDDRAARAGLFQGDLSDSEVAAEVVRRYIQALVEKDYKTAGILYNGRPADELQQRVEQTLEIKCVRLIAVGEPVSEPERGQRAYGVPFAFLIETADGKKEIAGPWGGKVYSPEAEANLDISKCRRAMVRPLVTDPDYWVIDGGI